jgi:metal-responsive CopG/Arc/MetJ family transcriptional regulator
MKTAISIPDDTFEKASRRAQDLGMSRSEFFARAAVRYLEVLDAESVTHQIDEALAALADHDEGAEDAVVVGRQVLYATPEW